MKRRWQEECLQLAINHFVSGNSYFSCVATPGSGKTKFSAYLAEALFELNYIDYVLCVAPSLTVKEGITETFEETLNNRFDGKFGSVGECITYQTFQFQYQELTRRLSNYRVLLVLDEIHHCGGNQDTTVTAWGRPLLQFIGQISPNVLSLSGTPWRSDKLPVTTLQYNAKEMLNAQYTYSLKDALNDENVCRKPEIYIVDNTSWRVTEDDKEERYHHDLKTLLLNEELNYQRVLEDSGFINYMLCFADKRLNETRSINKDAGGLIVASSISHAKAIANHLMDIANENPVLVTSEDDLSQQKLIDYKSSSAKWLVSVGMVSEGTDIPRLQVCCYLSRIRTELNFRQTLGRILRLRKSDKKVSAEFIIPAHNDLQVYAQRLLDEIPEVPNLIKYAKASTEAKDLESSVKLYSELSKKDSHTVKLTSSDAKDVLNHLQSDNLNYRSSQVQFSIYGRYVDEVMRYDLI
jgi:superfamily II DNA or RNA helicase